MLVLVLVLLLTLVSSGIAAPEIDLPINAQVPPVAVADYPYNFVFSESTFSSNDGAITYTLGSCPLWLQFDGPSRSFFGTPEASGVGHGEAGSFIVDLVATDGAGSTRMPVTFVVTVDPGPGLGNPVAAQLPAFGAYSSPDTLLLTPGAALSLTFSRNTFTNTHAHTMYYAICSNHTPLPSWLIFDPSSLTFSGSTPHATSSSELTQSYGIQLVASEITGFSQATTSFQLVLESHLFTFGNIIQIINTTIGSPVEYAGLQNDLILDGHIAKQSDIVQTSTDAPSWLSLSRDSLAISGTPPSNAVQQNFTVTAKNRYGDIASTVVLIQITDDHSTTLINPIDALNATVGMDFTFPLGDSIRLDKNVSVTVDSGTASAWLEFNSNSLELYGHIPYNFKPQMVQFNVTAIQGDDSQSQIVNINVTCKDTGCPANSYSGKPGTTGTDRAPGTMKDDSKKWIAAAVLSPLAALAGVSILLYCCCKRKWKLRLELRSKTKKKIAISRPMEAEKSGNVAERGVSSWDYGRQEQVSSEASTSPNVSWIPNAKLKRKSGFLLSRNDGEGIDGSSRPDSWQDYVKKFDPSRTRHPTAVEESSSDAGNSPTQTENGTNDSAQASPTRHLLSYTMLGSTFPRGYSQRRRPASNMNHGSVSLFSSQPTGGFERGQDVPGQDNGSLFYSNRDLSHGDSGSAGGPPGWGLVRNSWRNLSRLSWTSTQSSPDSNDPEVEEGIERPHTQRSFASILSSFPRPSSSNTAGVLNRPEVIQEGSNDELEPAALRVNKPLPRNASKAKSRSSKRKANAENEALQNFHKRRVQEKSHNPLFSAHLDTPRKPSVQLRSKSVSHQDDDDIMLGTVTPPKQAQIRSFSQSSSIRPSSINSSPEQASSSASPPLHKKSHTKHHLTTRTLSPLRRSRSSLASTTGSSKFPDPVGVAPFYPQGALLEDTDVEGTKRWRHPNHPNPLGTNRTNMGNITDVSDTELIDGLRAAGQFSAAERLEYLRAQTEDRNDKAEVDTAVWVRSGRGRRLDHRPGLKSSDSKNQSIEGDIEDAVGGRSAFM